MATKARKKFREEWDYFLSKINFAGSAMNARTTEFMNTIEDHLNKIELDFKDEIVKY